MVRGRVEGKFQTQKNNTPKAQKLESIIHFGNLETV